MKRSFRTLTLICAAMSILASCAKEESDPNSGKPAGPEPDQTYEYVFSLNEAALTRATLADDTILFEEGDKLGVVAVTPEKTTATEAEVFHVTNRRCIQQMRPCLVLLGTLHIGICNAVDNNINLVVGNIPTNSLSVGNVQLGNIREEVGIRRALAPGSNHIGRAPSAHHNIGHPLRTPADTLSQLPLGSRN